MWRSTRELPDPKELVIIDGADHLFDGHAAEVGEALEDLLGDFEEGATRRVTRSEVPE